MSTNEGLLGENHQKIKGIVKSTMPFVNATTHVIWDVVRDAREHKLFAWSLPHSGPHHSLNG